MTTESQKVRLRDRYIVRNVSIVKVNLSLSAPYEAEADYPVAYLSSINVTFVFQTKDKAIGDSRTCHKHFAWVNAI